MINTKDNSTILFIGDSITDVKFNKKRNRTIKGKNVYCLQTAKVLKENHKKLKFFYKGIASNRSYHVYDRLTKDCIAHKPDTIVLFIGVNDAWETYRPMDYPPLVRPFAPHMNEIFRRIKTELPDAKLIVLLPFLVDTIKEKIPFHEILEDFRKELKELALPTADAIVDLQEAFDIAAKTTPLTELTRDGVHPTSTGHKVIADSLLKVLS